MGRCALWKRTVRFVQHRLIQKASSFDKKTLLETYLLIPMLGELSFDSLKPQNIMPQHSRKYNNNFTKLQDAKKGINSEVFNVSKAVEVLESFEKPNFKTGASVEIHFKLFINPTKSDQLVRSSVVLPHGTGKEVKIAAFVNPENVELAKKLGAYRAGGEDLIDEIKASGKVDFDIAIAEPEMMKKLPSVARILGTAGVMPNPKTGTVGDDITSLINIIKAGKVDYKNDKSGNIHFTVGKLNSDFDTAKLIANIEAAIDSIEKAKPEALKKRYIDSIHLAGTMTPSVRVR